MDDKKVIYALTTNKAYKTRETENNIVIPVDQVKGFLHTKVQDSRMLDMTIDGKRVQVDLGSSELDNLTGSEKTLISKHAIGEQRPITFRVFEDGFNIHIAGLSKNIWKSFEKFTHPLPKSLVKNDSRFPEREKKASGKLIELADHGPVLQDENGDATLYNVYNFCNKDYMQLKQNGGDLIGKNVHIQINKIAELVIPIQVIDEKKEDKKQATVCEDENEMEDEDQR